MMLLSFLGVLARQRENVSHDNLALNMERELIVHSAVRADNIDYVKQTLSKLSALMASIVQCL